MRYVQLQDASRQVFHPVAGFGLVTMSVHLRPSVSMFSFLSLHPGQSSKEDSKNTPSSALPIPGPAFLDDLDQSYVGDRVLPST